MECSIQSFRGTSYESFINTVINKKWDFFEFSKQQKPRTKTINKGCVK